MDPMISEARARRPPTAMWSPRIALRLVAVTAAALVLFGVPYLTQVERVRHRALWGWGLYRVQGLGVLDLQYELVRDGTSVPLDRAELLGSDTVYGLKWRTRAPKLRQLVPHTNQLCRALRAQSGDAATLRLDARVSAWEGWIPVVDNLDDVCGAGKHALTRAVKSIALRRPRTPRIPLETWWRGASQP